LANEILRYLNYSPTPEEVNNPFLFWKNHCTEFGSLAELAKRYLTISCSSVPDELIFSTILALFSMESVQVWLPIN
jgi:hypothetical protein